MKYQSNQWLKIPLPLRLRWWEETDNGRRNPSIELLAEMESALATACEKSIMEEHGDVENEKK